LRRIISLVLERYIQRQRCPIQPLGDYAMPSSQSLLKAGGRELLPTT
jgi:hypothetical protein